MTTLLTFTASLGTLIACCFLSFFCGLVTMSLLYMAKKGDKEIKGIANTPKSHTVNTYSKYFKSQKNKEQL